MAADTFSSFFPNRFPSSVPRFPYRSHVPVVTGVGNSRCMVLEDIYSSTRACVPARAGWQGPSLGGWGYGPRGRRKLTPAREFRGIGEDNI